MAQPPTTTLLHLKPRESSTSPSPSTANNNPLPPLLHTPAGLALLELQGTFNLPADDDHREAIEIGRLDFPDYAGPESDPAWMRRVYLYVGRHQRLTGEVRKLPRAMGVVRRRPGEGLEVVEVVRYKIVFSSRPEPVGSE